MKSWQKCTDKADGDYADCDTCNGYVSCSGGVRYSDRPCPANLEWDNYAKRCEWVSPTCGKNFTHHSYSNFNKHEFLEMSSETLHIEPF